MNLSDKDLDRLFREASDRFEPDDSMLAWNRLEKNLAGKLPERPPGPPKRFGLRPLIWVPAAVLFAGLSFFLIKHHQPYRSLSTLPPSTLTRPVSPAPAAGASPALPSPAPDAGEAANQPNENGNVNKMPAANQKTEAGTVKEKNLRAGNSSHKIASSPGSNLPAAVIAEPSAAPIADGLPETNNRRLEARTEAARHSGMASLKKDQRKKAGGGNKMKSGKDKNGNIISGEVPNGTRNDESAGMSTVEKDGIPASPGERGSGNEGSDKTKIGSSRASRPEFAKTRLPSPVEQAGPSVADNKTSLALEAARDKKLITPSGSVQVRHPFTIGLVMGPDYTDGGVTSNQLGNSVGLSVAYYLSNRLSVNTGILYGVKSYSAKGGDFPPPRQPLRAFGSYPHAESANGTVTLFEIPLSLRYDFPIDGKTRLFVNAGLSSYLPLKETLTSYYHERNFTFGWRHVNDKPPSHWFAIGHFSGGIERDLGKGLSFQVEPYFNLPFTNVCTGNVKLNTYGVLISIRFSPVLSRKKG